MTPGQTARELFAVAYDAGRPVAERIAARDDLIARAKASKRSVARMVNLTAEGEADWAYILALKGCPEAPDFTDDEQHGLDSAHMAPEPGAPDLHDPLDESTPAELSPKATEAPTAAVRGLITAEVRRLLTDTDLPYSGVVEAVLSAFPEARTTARSVASVAADMRRAGLAVPMRRAAAK